MPTLPPDDTQPNPTQPTTTPTAQLAIACDIAQGYNFHRDAQTPVGFITKLKLGPTAEIKADQVCQGPTSTGSGLAVAVVLSAVHWSTGPADAISFTGRVSRANRQTILSILSRPLDSIEVVFQFIVYSYDPITKQYYTSFHCNGKDMTGVLAKDGGNPPLSVASAASVDVPSPQNYSVSLGIKPKPGTAQALTIATSQTASVVKPWGA